MSKHFYIVTRQPVFSWPTVIRAIVRHPRNLRVIGPDTALFNWQIARKLKWWSRADAVKNRLATIEPELKLAFCGDRYEVHQ